MSKQPREVTGRTVLMSPVMVAAAAVEGRIADARETFRI